MTITADTEKDSLQSRRSGLLKRYRAFQSLGLTLDMTRGKPCAEQLDLSLGMLDSVDSRNYHTDDGTDIRNYGGLDGIPDAKRLFAESRERVTTRLPKPAA